MEKNRHQGHVSWVKFECLEGKKTCFWYFKCTNQFHGGVTPNIYEE